VAPAARAAAAFVERAGRIMSPSAAAQQAVARMPMLDMGTSLHGRIVALEYAVTPRNPAAHRIVQDCRVKEIERW
jgi:hypothetical protein